MTARLTGLLALAAVVALGAAAPASAAQVQLSGVQTSLPDELIGSVYYLRSEMVAEPGSAGLNGQWYTPVFDLANETLLLLCREHEKTAQCSGTERFVGFLDRNGNGVEDPDEERGTLDFAFTFSASASGNARCHHPVTGGTGGFAGAAGQLTLKDRIGACGEAITTYKGHLTLAS
jgi:hypothetical protein